MVGVLPLDFLPLSSATDTPSSLVPAYILHWLVMSLDSWLFFLRVTSTTPNQPIRSLTLASTYSATDNKCVLSGSGFAPDIRTLFSTIPDLTSLTTGATFSARSLDPRMSANRLLLHPRGFVFASTYSATAHDSEINVVYMVCDMPLLSLSLLIQSQQLATVSLADVSLCGVIIAFNLRMNHLHICPLGLLLTV